MNIFKRRKKSLVRETIEVHEGLAFRSEEYLKAIPLLIASHHWLQMVLNRQATVRDQPEIEKLLSEMQAMIVRAEAHHEVLTESRKAK